MPSWNTRRQNAKQTKSRRRTNAHRTPFLSQFFPSKPALQLFVSASFLQGKKNKTWREEAEAELSRHQQYLQPAFVLRKHFLIRTSGKPQQKWSKTQDREAKKSREAPRIHHQKAEASDCCAAQKRRRCWAHQPRRDSKMVYPVPLLCPRLYGGS